MQGIGKIHGEPMELFFTEDFDLEIWNYFKQFRRMGIAIDLKIFIGNP